MRLPGPRRRHFSIQVQTDGTLVAVPAAIGEAGRDPGIKPAEMPIMLIPPLYAPMDGRAYVRVNGEWAAIVEDIVHGAGCGRRADHSPGRSSTAACCCSTRWASTPTASALLGFGAVQRNHHSGLGRDGIYLVTARSSGSGNQSTSLGMGVLINGAKGFSETNQMLERARSVSYTFDNDATQLLQLAEGDTIELINNSVSSGPECLHQRLDGGSAVSIPDFKVLSAVTRFGDDQREHGPFTLISPRPRACFDRIGGLRRHITDILEAIGRADAVSSSSKANSVAITRAGALSRRARRVEVLAVRRQPRTKSASCTIACSSSRREGASVVLALWPRRTGLTTPARAAGKSKQEITSSQRHQAHERRQHHL